MLGPAQQPAALQELAVGAEPFVQHLRVQPGVAGGDVDVEQRNASGQLDAGRLRDADVEVVRVLR